MSGTALPGSAPARDLAPAASPSGPAPRAAELKLVAPGGDVPARPASDDATRRRIVASALRLARAPGGWDAVHVHAVAREAGATMEEVHRQFPDKDSIAEGFFDMADAAMTAAARDERWPLLPLRERLFTSLMAWLDALAPHRRVVADMLGYKLHPEHVHLQVRGVARISRTVQWWREVALSPATGWRRELEEAVLTSIYLATFARWMMDASPGADGTRRQLRRALALAERGGGLLGYSR
ncbi:TetR/AcrR family transcriptional regulator [Ramlibacter sp. RBP-2]|uniref:TetR/AcrR family transcriptional regulator n=1 Tax=Ramlibacter lithotrophicus TaxID=2606681 RepID=A0A7X6DE79_9BURK|nr:TetR/AcrR family transcriptional regulator [Ramlibacter lithotrophicus]NKE65473.1 TetR/AcrR family transcriptional regulator [Ramlibacter lithotrophicus]